jgi:hypothetical protein
MLEGIMKTIIGVSQSARSSNVANNGMQSHFGTHLTRKINLLMTSDLNFHWLLVHFVLSSSLRVL